MPGFTCLCPLLSRITLAGLGCGLDGVDEHGVVAGEFVENTAAKKLKLCRETC
jgi:hypothetical protein